MKFSRVVVAGSLAYDHIMSMPGKFSDHIMADKIHMINVSFFMETFRREFGGTGGNIAYGLSLLNTASLLVGAVGHDFGPYTKHLKKLKVLDTSGIKKFAKLATAQGFAMTDQDDNQIWGFYTGAVKEAEKISLKSKLKKTDLVIVAPDNVEANMNRVNEAIGVQVAYMFDPAFNITHFKVADLRLAVENCSLLVGNDYEIELMRRKLKWTKAKLLGGGRIVITTLGAKGSVINESGKTYKIPVAKVKNTSDPTGAGDAYRAGFLAGYVRGLSLEVCGRMGSVSAAYTVEKYGTQTHEFSVSGFGKRYKQNFGELIRL